MQHYFWMMISHLLVCEAWGYFKKLVQYLFHKLMDWLSRMAFELFIAPLIDKTEAALKLLLLRSFYGGAELFLKMCLAATK